MKRMYTILIVFCFLIFVCNNKSPVLNDKKNVNSNPSANIYNPGIRNTEIPMGKVIFTKVDSVTGKILLYRINTDGSSLMCLNSKAEYQIYPYYPPKDPKWSPDGKRILYYTDHMQAPKIILADEYGNSFRVLETGRIPEWSPGGDGLTFLYGGDVVFQAVMDTSGNYKRLTDFIDLEQVFAGYNVKLELTRWKTPWDADGEHIFLWGSIDINGSNENDFFAVNAKSGIIEERMGYKGTSVGQNYLFSPDAKKIIWNGLYYISISDSTPVKIVGGGTYFSSWSNDSKYLIFLNDEINGLGELVSYIYLIDPEDPNTELRLFDFDVYTESAPDIYFGEVDTGIWDEN